MKFNRIRVDHYVIIVENSPQFSKLPADIEDLSHVVIVVRTESRRGEVNVQHACQYHEKLNSSTIKRILLNS